MSVLCFPLFLCFAFWVGGYGDDVGDDNDGGDDDDGDDDD